MSGCCVLIKHCFSPMLNSRQRKVTLREGMLSFPAGGFTQERLCCEESWESQARLCKLKETWLQMRLGTFSLRNQQRQGSAGHMRSSPGGLMNRTFEQHVTGDKQASGVCHGPIADVPPRRGRGHLLFAAGSARFTSCYLFSPTETLGTTPPWVISRGFLKMSSVCEWNSVPLRTLPSSSWRPVHFENLKWSVWICVAF